jgi:hypothetical protein
LRMVARVWWCGGWVGVGVVLGLEAMVLLCGDRIDSHEDGWVVCCRERLGGLARFGTGTLGGVTGLVMGGADAGEGYGGVMMR